MLLSAPGVYPDFTTEEHLEELLLSMAWKILDLQLSASNTEGVDIINATSDDETRRTNITFNNIEGSIQDGVLVCKNYFPSFTFQSGTGSYPFNRLGTQGIVNAFIHLLIYQQSKELDGTLNDNEAALYCKYSLTHTSTQGSINPIVVSASMDNYPLIYAYSNGSQNKKAKPYLGITA
ncbi:MAG: hypothetical protein ACKPEN_01660 [Planktothrix sp.]|uniref:hypothetical protein n=1 Tax=Planktothrix sp. TaxID=3088171 RepID=UPI0038D3EFBD